jgi:hypothetical protein
MSLIPHPPSTCSVSPGLWWPPLIIILIAVVAIVTVVAILSQVVAAGGTAWEIWAIAGVVCEIGLTTRLIVARGD